jgi:hypothetical protein
MKQRQLFPEGAATRIAVVIGAGASRGVSYAEKRATFNHRLTGISSICCSGSRPGQSAQAVQSVVKQAQKLSYDCLRSMERAFYTIHLRA